MSGDRIRNLFDHPLARPDWEVIEASPVRTFGRGLWRAAGDSLPERIVHARAVQGVSGPLRVVKRTCSRPGVILERIRWALASVAWPQRSTSTVGVNQRNA